MREILFRGKRVDNGEWVEGFYQLYICPEYGAEFHTIHYDNNEEADVDPETVGQYTGLKDKNGKRIFEGDVITDGEYVDRVEWKEGSFQVEPCAEGLCEYNRVSEIVGNIHEGEWVINDEVGYVRVHDKEQP